MLTTCKRGNISNIFYLCLYMQAGPQICIGKDFAYMQIKIVSIALLCFFRFKLADDRKNVTYKTKFTLQIDGGLHLCGTSRTLS